MTTRCRVVILAAGFVANACTTPKSANDRLDAPGGGAAGMAGGAAGRGGGTSGTAGTAGTAGSSGGSISDGSADSPDATQVGVVGTAIDTHMTDNGNEPHALDFSKYAMEALVYSAGSGFSAAHVPVFSSGDAGDGSFSFPNLPAGEYYLLFHEKNTTATYFITSARELDLGRYRLGRHDAKRVSLDTSLRFTNLTGLDSWQDGDSFDLYCRGAGSAIFLMQDVASAGRPIPGAIALTDFTIDYAQNARAPNLIEGDKGDVVWLTQLVARPLQGPEFYLALARVLKIEGLSQVDEQQTTLAAATLVAPQAETTVHVTAQFAEFEQLWRAGNPSATYVANFGGIWAQPEVAKGFVGPTPDLARFDAPEGTKFDADLTFGNPFPGGLGPDDFGMAMSVHSMFFRELRVAGATPTRITGFFETLQTVKNSDIVTVSPLVGPVRNLRVAGRDAMTDDVSGVGTEPRISWQAPESDGGDMPTDYWVRVSRLRSIIGATQREPWATLRTTGTEFVMPPRILDPGSSYVFVVSAVWRQRIDIASQPFASNYPQGWADVISGLITP